MILPQVDHLSVQLRDNCHGFLDRAKNILASPPQAKPSQLFPRFYANHLYGEVHCSNIIGLGSTPTTECFNVRLGPFSPSSTLYRKPNTLMPSIMFPSTFNSFFWVTIKSLFRHSNSICTHPGCFFCILGKQKLGSRMPPIGVTQP